MKGVGRVHFEYSKKKGREEEIIALRVFIGKKLANLKMFENKDQVKIYCYPDEKRIIVEEFS